MKLFKFFEFFSFREARVPFRYSEDFLSRLNQIDSPISSELISLKSKPMPYTYVEVGGTDDTVIYIDGGKIKKYAEEHKETDLNHFVRQNGFEMLNILPIVETKIGKFVKKTLPEKSPYEIEQFVNKWKAIFSDSKFELWNSKEIPEAYRSDRYTHTKHATPLSNSCMNDKEYVQFYKYCPGLKMLVMLDKEGQISGRALIWKDYADRLIMDRVYYTHDSDYFKFIEYAKQNRIYYRSKNAVGEPDSFVFDGKTISLRTKVRIPDVFRFKEDGFPYMDTFYCAQGEWAMNYEPEEGMYLKLRDTDGMYYEYSNKYDIYGDEIEDEADYVYSKTQGGYIYSDWAQHIKYDGGKGFEEYSFDDWIEADFLKTGYSPGTTNKAFVKCEDKWYLKDDCVYSQAEKRWIWRPTAIQSEKDWISAKNF